MLEEFTFFIIGTENEIILTHAVSGRLGLTQVFCHNKAKEWIRADIMPQTDQLVPVAGNTAQPSLGPS